MVEVQIVERMRYPRLGKEEKFDYSVNNLRTLVKFIARTLACNFPDVSVMRCALRGELRGVFPHLNKFPVSTIHG